jgi:Holin of 3TMs, for gene-transfer release
MTTEAQSNKEWLSKTWRPFMAWSYMIACMADFVVFPILWSIAQALVNGGQVTTQWNPITLQGAGLYHIAMGAIVGVTAYGRTREKLKSIQE